MTDTRIQLRDERQGSWMSARDGGTAVLVAIAYYLGARLGFALTLAPVPVSILWPPNAILLSGLLLARRRNWLPILATVLIAHLAVQFQSGVPIGMVLCWYISNCTEALLAALLLGRLGRTPPAFETLGSVAIFLACAIAAPFLSSFLDAGFVKLNGWGAADYWTVWRTRFFSNVLAMITLVPAVLTTARALPHMKNASRRAIVEGTLGVAALTAVCWYIFAEHLPGPGTTPALLYSPLPILLAGAVRFGPWGVSIGMLLCSLVAIWGAGHGLGPFVTSSPRENALAIQLFLLIGWVPLMALAALIRERAAAGTAVRASEEQLAIALDAAQLGRWEFDVATERLTWSDATRRLYEIGPDVPVDRGTFETLIHPDDRAIVAAVDGEVARGRSFDVEFRILFPDGRIKWIHSKGKAIFDDQGQPQRIVGVKADITQRKAAELQLHEQQQRLAQSSRAAVAGELSVALAHELNQPLAAILVNASAARRFLLQNPPDLQEISEIVEAIAHDNRRAAEVIKRFGTLLSHGGLRRSLLDMNEVVETVLDVARGDLLSRGVSVTRHLAPSLPCVLGDATQLQQVLLNLIANGCDAMEPVTPGRRRLRVETGTNASGEVTVTVSDCGPGVPEDRASEIFEPFVTSHPQRLGLGLAICRSIASAHDGRLWVDRAPFGGAAFWLALPVTAAASIGAPADLQVSTAGQ